MARTPKPCKEHRRPNFVQSIGRQTIGWAYGNKEPSGGWSKAAMTTSFCQFIEHFARVRGLEAAAHEHLRLIAPLLQHCCISKQVFGVQ